MILIIKTTKNKGVVSGKLYQSSFFSCVSKDALQNEDKS